MPTRRPVGADLRPCAPARHRADAEHQELQDLHLFRPGAGLRTHIDALFSGLIDWTLIAEHLPDMLSVALSIKAGRLLPPAILRRLRTYSRKNRLYFAFRELGRDPAPASTIGAATNKSEHFNRYAQWTGSALAGA